ncbi:hypothetical protein BC628DRAFT_911431 [Trametes gibbosa]|nr:hypothetical protein BC628DRAFT_911431 [Trametes gibbosa]
MQTSTPLTARLLCASSTHHAHTPPGVIDVLVRDEMDRTLAPRRQSPDVSSEDGSRLIRPRFLARSAFVTLLRAAHQQPGRRSSSAAAAAAALARRSTKCFAVGEQCPSPPSAPLYQTCRGDTPRVSLCSATHHARARLRVLCLRPEAQSGLGSEGDLPGPCRDGDEMCAFGREGGGGVF